MKYLYLVFFLSLIACQEQEYTEHTTESLIIAHQKASGANLLGATIKTLSLTETTLYDDNSSFTAFKKFEFPTKLIINQVYPGYTQDFILNGEEGLSVANQIEGKTATKEQVAQFKENAHLMQFYRWKERGWSYEYIGKEKIGTLDYYVLVGKQPNLQLQNKVFLHPSTYLIAKIILRSSIYNASSEFFDYFKAEGLQYPEKYTTTSNNITTTTQTSDFAINPTFPPNTFEIKTEKE